MSKKATAPSGTGTTKTLMGSACWDEFTSGALNVADIFLW